MKIDIVNLKEYVDKEVTLVGWVDTIRDHGNVIFIILRDRSASVQLVMSDKELIAKMKDIHTEDLISIKGTVTKRPQRMVNENLTNGDIEIQVMALEIVSPSAALPFELDRNTKVVNEMTRLTYRYLDLRSERMKTNIKSRHLVNQFLRNYLSEKGFWEIETPCLTKGTPEGAREFIVPSRLHKGDFYVLPQSPQQFKQLLMVGGMEKYFQIARCFRDEDQRGDRQPEFTQLDIEMSFVNEEEIMTLIEECMIQLVRITFPHLTIQQIPFPRLTYREAIEKYKSDKPDLRKKKEPNVLEFGWVVDFPLFEFSAQEKKLVSTHHPFTHPKEEDVALLDKQPLEARAKAYDLVLNGYEVGGGSIRIHLKDLQNKIFSLLGLSEDEKAERFGHILRAFEFSPPPHGGIALGLDRLISILVNEENIREVIAFPKTGDAKDLLMGSPSPIPKKNLKEVGIDVMSSPEK